MPSIIPTGLLWGSKNLHLGLMSKRGGSSGAPLFEVYVRRWVWPVQSCCYIRPRPRLFYSEVDPRVPCTQTEALGAPEEAE